MMPPTRSLPIRLARAAALGLALVATGCARQGAEDPAAEAWVRAMAQASSAADEALAKGERAEAASELALALEREVPGAVNPADRDAVHRDLCFRLSELARDQGDLGPAVAWADKGLAVSDAPDLFTVNLLVARAKALERGGRDGEAAISYHDALKISEALLAESLGKGDE